ncbi:hemerythrin domain-containing protein [uncultured Roseovarius sp.]|uniref:hemerythrin domain-containing protein n=1 Tax=uncultured Roseovarius sp. TaxID=293344 RepID=UPI0025E951DC|nr:hemerythrin domain-containing protein [uncultured Roseovarius sp.]
MPWRDEFSTGNVQIDLQHKLLFKHTEVFREVLEAGAGIRSYSSFLEFLQTFIEIHFGYEEECMFAHMCPCAGQNKKEHEVFSKFVANQVASYEQEGFNRHKASVLLARVDDWLENHIARIDVKLGHGIIQEKHNS